MTTTVVHCDRCRCVVEADRTVLTVTSGHDRHRPDVDLCRSCFEAWLAWLNAGALASPTAPKKGDSL
jgi:hypothetical protein